MQVVRVGGRAVGMAFAAGGADESPQLPAGYAAMLLVAYVPPVWRRVMDKRVVAHYGGDLTKANLQPSQRDKLLARYAPA